MVRPVTSIALRGAKVSDLPVQYPTKFRLVIICELLDQTTVACIQFLGVNF